MHRVQAQELYDYEEQADDARPAGVQEILSLLSTTYTASGD